MKVTRSGAIRQQEISSSRSGERRPVSNTFEAMLADQALSPAQGAERGAPLPGRAFSFGNLPIISAQAEKVLDQGEVKFFENILAAAPLGRGARSVQDQLQSAIRLNRLG